VSFPEVNLKVEVSVPLAAIVVEAVSLRGVRLNGSAATVVVVVVVVVSVAVVVVESSLPMLLATGP
jgi:hypothetical protein